MAALVRAAVDWSAARCTAWSTRPGVAGGGPVHLLPADEWARVIAVNLTGTYLTAKHVIAQMLGQPARDDGQRGSVVTVASIEGLEGTAGGSAYSASKGGVVILTKNMAIDYAGRGIRVNAICPGFIETPMTDDRSSGRAWRSALADIVHEHKLGRRMGLPDGDRRGGRVLALRRRVVRDRATRSRSTAATRPAATTASPRCWGSRAPSDALTPVA